MQPKILRFVDIKTTEGKIDVAKIKDNEKVRVQESGTSANRSGTGQSRQQTRSNFVEATVTTTTTTFSWPIARTA